MVVQEAAETMFSPLYSCVVYAVYEHRGVIFGRSGLNNFLRTRIDVRLAGFFGQEETGAFDDDINANFFPLQFCRITFSGQANFLAINNQICCRLLQLRH